MNTKESECSAIVALTLVNIQTQGGFIFMFSIRIGFSKTLVYDSGGEQI